jgi:hypothetical protein
LPLEDEEFEDMIPIEAATAICNNYEDGMNDPKPYKTATESLLAYNWDTAMKEELDTNGQH